MTAPFFHAETELLRVGTVVLSGSEGRHAVSVRRLRVGEDVVLTDGDGAGAYGVVVGVEGKDRLTVEVTEVRVEAAPRPRIVVVQALPKGDRGEVAVETMTETGVDVIVPWDAGRAITRWKGERGAKSLAKWRAGARGAAKQARRVRVPEVWDLASSKEVASLLEGAAFAGVLHEEGAAALATAAVPSFGDVVLVVGPEGGVSPDELALFAGVGAGVFRLGPTVLRTSTAGVAACALLLSRTPRWS